MTVHTKRRVLSIAVVAMILCLILMSSFDPAVNANSTRTLLPSVGSDVPGVPYFPAQYPPVSKPDSTEQAPTF